MAYEGPATSPGRFDSNTRAELPDLDSLSKYLKGLSQKGYNHKKKILVAVDKTIPDQSLLERAIKSVFPKAEIEPIDFKTLATVIIPE